MSNNGLRNNMWPFQIFSITVTWHKILIATIFLKPFVKGKFLQSGRWERGKFGFDQHSAFLTDFLKRYLTFCLVASFSARQEDHFQKKLSIKWTFPSDFVKLGSKILYLFLAEKMVVCFVLVVCFVCLFVAIPCPILVYFFLNWRTHRAEKDAFKEKMILFTAWELPNP